MAPRKRNKQKQVLQTSVHAGVKVISGIEVSVTIFLKKVPSFFTVYLYW